jgi:site-specific DNA-methyltransferase (adenine-specific)
MSGEPGHLVCGDGLRIMRSLPDGIFDAIYLDPPFRTGKPQAGDRAAFPDAWDSIDSYLDWLYPFVEEAHRLLSPAGWFWLHLDWHSVHYAKVLADSIFGQRRFRNEIIWHYTGRRQPADRRFNQKHDTLLLYARSAQSRLAPVSEPWTRDDYVRMKRQQIHQDADGREWIWGHAGKGRSRAYRIYIDEQVDRGRAIDSVWDIPIINTSAGERTGFPTQKPVALLERICLASVREGGLIGDFLAGSGTTGVAAYNTGRRFFLVDRLEEAVTTAAERLRDAGCAISPQRLT